MLTFFSGGGPACQRDGRGDTGQLRILRPAGTPLGVYGAELQEGFHGDAGPRKALRGEQLTDRGARRFANSAGLQGTHRGLHFNDNGDGTLSVVGAPPSFANERSIVVSQRSRSQEEMEPLAECIPHKKAVAPRPSLPTEHKETTDPSATAGSSSPAQGDPQAMMRYLRPHLHQTNLDQAFKSYHVEICLALPRVRDVVWNKDRLEKAPFKDTLPRDISSMIIQLTGDYAAKPCDHCVDRRGPYEGCVLIRPDAPLEMQKIITSWSVFRA